ncbi:hypothetical protein M413DRAFT_445951 [Hebeloma cylindrosporum]|uniref:Myb-like domain-containing protein n=1 Tax=Hebeloma cylindrosporum TaxID=76867 RepID=A0A0C2YHC8_HEBCY|nr:hypothetical protein M413DRAFT_445951 [Hebeloma cylindrosporum h7]
MDNPQHYQPLSDALHPLSSSVNRTHNNHYTATGHPISYAQPQPQKATNQAALQQEEEEEEEEEDDGDEGLVEEQLHQSDADAAGSDVESPKPSSSAPPQNSSALASREGEPSPAPEQKRRPGRPRGSKNRRPRIGSAKHETQFYYQSQNTSQTTATPSGPPTHPNITPQNQQYYEFQWRVLNLCAEFYGAAEELVKGISPLVIAQCYHMGPSAKVDPLSLLADAKRICDTLLANPSQLVSNPPPPIYPVLPTLRHPSVSPAATMPTASTSTTGASTSASTPQSSIITNPQSFVVPLGAQPAYPQYSMYPPQGHYPTTPYYQYPPYGQPAYYPPPPVVPPPAPSAPSVSVAPTPQPTATITTTPATGGTVIGNQGAWSEEETERLKKLAEESKSKGTSGEIEWEWLIAQWGISRTRHQILIKATALGLKESSTRGVKRRRENEGTSSDAPMASLQPSAASSGTLPSTASPAHSASQQGSTPAASPAMQNQQRPASSKGHSSMSSTTAAPKLPWPMPTVAVNTVAPVVAASSSVQEQQRSSYYRPRPNQTDSSGGKSTTMAQPPPTTHQFSMYAPNGMRKENGK